MKIYRGTPFKYGPQDAHFSMADIDRLFVGPCLSVLREDFLKQKLPLNSRIEFSYVITDEEETHKAP